MAQTFTTVGKNCYNEEWFGLVDGLSTGPVNDGFILATYRPHSEGQITLAHLCTDFHEQQRTVYNGWLSSVAKDSLLLVAIPKINQPQKKSDLDGLIHRELSFLQQTGFFRFTQRYNEIPYPFSVNLLRSGLWTLSYAPPSGSPPLFNAPKPLSFDFNEWLRQHPA